MPLMLKATAIPRTLNQIYHETLWHLEKHKFAKEGDQIINKMCFSPDETWDDPLLDWAKLLLK